MKIRTYFVYAYKHLYIAALKIGAENELILSILKPRRYLGNRFREFPGTVEQSFSPPCVCARNRGGRSTPLLSSPFTRCLPMRILSSTSTY